MELPGWVENAIRKFEPPQTGKVEIVLEMYFGGVTKMEIGTWVRIKGHSAEYEREAKEYQQGKLAGPPVYEK